MIEEKKLNFQVGVFYAKRVVHFLAAILTPLLTPLLGMVIALGARAQNLSQLGWPQSLSSVYFYLDQESSKNKNFVIIANWLPNQTLDYRSSSGLREAINRFQFVKDFHPGHIMLGFKCEINGVKHNSFVGFSGENSGQIRKMISDGWGLTSILSTYTDGAIETPARLELRLESLIQSQAVAQGLNDLDSKSLLLLTVIEVSESSCGEIINELYSFNSHPQRANQNFSLMAHPEKYEGAVCNTFAFHLISQAHELSEVSDLFRRELLFPSFLFGRGSKLPENVKLNSQVEEILGQRAISGFKLMNLDWRPSDFSNLSVKLMDPELIILWQKTLLEHAHQVGTQQKIKNYLNKYLERFFWEIEREDSGVYLNKRKLRIEAALDDQTQRVADHARALSAQRESEIFYLQDHPVLILKNKN